MPKHAIDPGIETRQDTLDRLAGKVRRALQEYLTAYRADLDQPTVLEWAAEVEYSTPATERQRQAAFVTVCEADRIAASTIEGLGLRMAGMTR